MFKYGEQPGGFSPEVWTQRLAHYTEVSKELTGAPAPELLKIREYDLDRLDRARWGVHLNEKGSWPNLYFPYRYAVFTEDDWQRIIVRGESDDLLQVESSEDLWQKWLHTFELYPSRRSHFFELLGDAVQQGRVYILRGVNSRLCKPGWTTVDPVVRLAQLQTGSAEKLELVGHFRAASDKAEEVLHKHFHSKRVRADGEWFALTEEDLVDIFDEKWRQRNQVF